MHARAKSFTNRNRRNRGRLCSWLQFYVAEHACLTPAVIGDYRAVPCDAVIRPARCHFYQSAARKQMVTV